MWTPSDARLGDHFVALDLVCATNESHKLVRFLIPTGPDQEAVLSLGYWPAADKRIIHQDWFEGRVRWVFYCRSCQTNPQVTEARIEARLRSMWSASGHAVERMPI
jgi:hypothetical protein